MTTTSLRSRLSSPEVRSALTSPSGILAAGAGAAVGIMATVTTAGLAVPVLGALVGGAIGGGVRAATALPARGTAPPVHKRDVFTIGEPWRHQVIDALKAQTRWTEAVRSFPDGPLLTSVSVVGTRLAEAVEECWEVGRRGDRLTKARRRINDRHIRNELRGMETQLTGGGPPSATQQRTLDSLKAQIATSDRMDALITQTDDELSLLNAQLDEAVTQAIELSVTNHADELQPMESDVAAIVDNLSNLRHAMDDLDDPSSTSTSP